MIAPTTKAKIEAIRTNPALTSLIVLISESISIVILLQIFSIAVLIISDTSTKVIDSESHSHSAEDMQSENPRATATIAATR